MTCRFAIPAALLAVAALSAPASATLFLSTGQTGAQVQTDINHTQSWTFYSTTGITGLTGASLTMKRGSQTSHTVNFSVYPGDPNVVPPVLNITLSPSSFTQQWQPILFTGAAFDLYSNTTSTAVLSSDAPDAQARAFFIKGGDFFFSDASGNPTPPPGGGQLRPGPAPNIVPEPAALGLLAPAAVALLRRRSTA